MAAKSKYLTAVKIFLRSLIFYGIWLAPLITFYVWHWHNLKSFFKALENSPWQFVFLAAGWWFLCWVSMYALQTVWPVLLLIFYGTERERSPKKIITIGDRFRKMSLSTPQIYSLKEKSRFWANKIWGFYSLPSPLGALLLVDEALLQKMPVEQLDMWICRQVIESRFSRFSSVRFQFFALVPTITLLGAFFGSAFSKFDTLLTAGTTLGFFVFAVFLWRKIQIQRMHELDRKTVNDFHLDAQAFFDSLAEAEKISPTFAFAQKFLGMNFDQRVRSLEKKSWFRAWLTWAVPPAFIVLFVLGFFVQTPMSEISQVMRAGITRSKYAIIEGPESEAPQAKATGTTEPKATSLPEPKATSLPEPKATSLPEPKAAVAAAAPPTEMSQAVYNGDWRTVIHQLGLGKSLHSGDPNINGATPLMLAVKKGDFDMVYFLLALGSNANTEVDLLGRSVLFYALECDQRQQMVNYIMRTRVDVNKKSNDGLTAVDYAKKNGWLDVIDLLVRRTTALDPSDPSSK